MFTKLDKTKSIICSLALIIILIILDQATKLMAIEKLKSNNDFILIKGVLQFHYLENTGAAFSLLEGKMPLFLVLTPIMVFILFYLLIKMPQNKKYVPLDLIILFTIAGAIGNFIDRIRFSFVVDFIYFSLINFPVFNVADIYVTCSVIILIILILFYYKDEDFEDILKDIKPKFSGK